MSLFFVADTHLNEAEPAITAGFFRFLQQLPDHSQLYILGDLFDYWVGDDMLTPLQQEVAKQLATLSQRGIKSYFIHGNRDFLLGKQYAQRCQMEILPAVYTLEYQQQKIVILHGDLLCTDDVAYQRFRNYMHNRFLQRLFLCLPLWIRNKIADRLRQKSQHYNSQKQTNIMDVNQQAVIDMLHKYQADIMIHGHTHKPAVHQINLADKQVERLVLGAWHDDADYVQFDRAVELKPYHIETL